MGSKASRPAASPVARQLTYRIEFDVTVNNPVEIWRTAFTQTLARTNLTAAEIIETIGSSSDIQVLDCLYLLADPARYGGCEVTSLAIRPE